MTAPPTTAVPTTAPPPPPSGRAVAHSTLGIVACCLGATSVAISVLPMVSLAAGPLGLAALVLAIVCLAFRRATSPLYPVLGASFGATGLAIGVVMLTLVIWAVTPGDAGDAFERPTPKLLAFGETYTYPDGVAVTVAEPEPFVPSERARVDGPAEYLAITFTIDNGSEDPLDPMPYPTVSSAGRDGVTVVDPNRTERTPATIILPGAAATWTETFAVADARELVLEVSPSVGDYAALVFVRPGPGSGPGSGSDSDSDSDT